MTDKKVAVEFVKKRLTFTHDADDPFAMFQLHLVGAVAELERSLIRERQREGIAVAKAKGKYRGSTATLTPEQVTKARHVVATGVPKAAIARQLGFARSVLYDALAGRGPTRRPLLRAPPWSVPRKSNCPSKRDDLASSSLSLPQEISASRPARDAARRDPLTETSGRSRKTPLSRDAQADGCYGTASPDWSRIAS